MSMLSSLRSNGNGKTHGAPPPAPPPAVSAFAKPTGGPRVEPHQLGSTTLQSVDLLTGMSAEEIEHVADQLINAAHETADVLREAARRVRHSGLIANERLANFVRVASTCADAARMMADSVEHRDDPQPEPVSEVKPLAPAVVATAPNGTTDLDKLASEMGISPDHEAVRP